MHDLLADELWQWNHLENVARKLFQNHGYSEIRTPILEETRLFEAGIGESTNIIAKELYSLTDPKERSFTLRPEGTVSTIRAYIEHKLHTQEPLAKLYYIGPMFRYRRPLEGRGRQFYQIGAEAIGSASPLVDFEIIEIAHSLFRKLGCKKAELVLNNLGCPKDRLIFAEALRKYFEEKLPMLCADCQQWMDKNPLRALACEVETCRKLATDSPDPPERICDDCKKHFDAVRELLRRTGIEYSTDHRLVRGPDYYTRTIFEIRNAELGPGTNMCEGGRYDKLVERVGGQPTPAVGFSVAMEAVVLAMEKERIKTPHQPTPDAFICSEGEKPKFETALLAARLRDAGLWVETDYKGESIKAQTKLAHVMRSKFVVVIGEEELKQGSALVRETATGAESIVPMIALSGKLLGE